MNITNYKKICDAVVLLMQPLVEIVIHDLKEGNITYIEGNLSNRKVGEPSFIQKGDIEENLHKIIYPKINFNGRLIKSISIPIDNEFLICINCDVSIFQEMSSLSKKFLNVNHQEGPESLFKNDWQENLHVTIYDYLSKKSWRLDTLTQKQKKEILQYLHYVGALAEKKSADYIANVLKLGRATVFKYLKEWRNQ